MERRQRHVLAGIVLVSLSLVSCAGTKGYVEADLVPHQAIYRMQISETSPTSRFNGMTGAAVSLIERNCEGWVVNEQIVMTMSTVAGGAIDREMQFKAHESLDGRTFSFESHSVTNGEAESFSGSARRQENGKAEAEFVTPRPFEMNLPSGTHFYVGMTQWMIDLAKSGARTGETYSFDGTDDKGPQKVTAFILPDHGAGPGISGDATLLSAKAWEVRLAFFKTDTQASQPEFEMSLRLLENGIITRFKLVFDDMVIDQILEDVLSAKDEHCG